MTSRDDPLIAHPTGFTTPVKIIAGFALLEMTVAGAWAILHGKTEFVFYLIAFIPFSFLLGLLHRRIRFSLTLLAGLTLLILLHLAGGLVELPRKVPTEGSHLLYNWWIWEPHLKFDQFVHALGSMLSTWFCWQLMQRTVASRTGWAFRDLRPTPELMLFCVLSGLGIGALNEVMEFATTQFIKDNNVGGYVNNSVDLVANMVGSVIAAAAIWFSYRLKAPRGEAPL